MSSVCAGPLILGRFLALTEQLPFCFFGLPFPSFHRFFSVKLFIRLVQPELIAIVLLLPKLPSNSIFCIFNFW